MNGDLFAWCGISHCSKSHQLKGDSGFFATSVALYRPPAADSLSKHTDRYSPVLIEADVPFQFGIVQSSQKPMIPKYRSFEYESGLSIAQSEVFWGTMYCNS